ncbi:fructose 1,6-bisphosphatase [Microbacterium sp. Clip185]|uniref:fructose 1,6-bisphosphatase n=1 Tax=Microbacterium sp. Clip185 TaxID=3025663 RepID=UPI0023659C6A|nr:fructose 1,6-bisphosphatase [Microbacterium sp. Clip185]WDG17621.1 fructose 1,6-bisphosphatase [Microbacterium sp. Clip185]
MRIPFADRGMRRLSAGAALVLASTLALTGCSQIVDGFNSLQGTNNAVQPTTVVPSPAPSASMAFNSQFTYDGSVELRSDVADDLELVLNVWAVDPKRTQEWTANNEKVFGFAVNVYDHRVDEKAVLTDKRRVYISSVQINSTTTQTSNQMQSPYQFSADPRTLVPSDTLRSDRGLLLNSFQGGLYVPQQSIHQLPADTFGLTLEFALTISVEGTANTDASFQQQTVYQYLPIAIFPG